LFKPVRSTKLHFLRPNMDPNKQYATPDAWQTNAFNNQFRNNANQEGRATSSGGANPMQFLSYFPQPSTMQYSDNNADSFIKNDESQPKDDLYHGAAFPQSGNSNPNPQVSLVEPDRSRNYSNLHINAVRHS